MSPLSRMAFFALLLAACGHHDATESTEADAGSDLGVGADGGRAEASLASRWTAAYVPALTRTSGDKPILPVPAMLANGHALTWDSRLAIVSGGASPKIAAITSDMLSTVLAPTDPTMPKVVTSSSTTPYSVPKPGTTSALAVSVDVVDVNAACDSTQPPTCGPAVECSAAIRTAGSSTILWRTPGFLCSGSAELRFDGAALQLYDPGSPAATPSIPAKVLWTSGTTPMQTSTSTAALNFYGTSPYIAIVNTKGTKSVVWDTEEGPTAIWFVQLFSAETFGGVQPTSPDELATNLNGAFTQKVAWGVPGTYQGHEADFATTNATTLIAPQALTGLPTLNSLAIVPTPGITPNPAPVPCHVSSHTGCVRYDMTVYTPSFPLGSKSPVQIAVLHVVAVVSGAYGLVGELALESIVADRVPEAGTESDDIATPIVADSVVYEDGKAVADPAHPPIAGIEPTVTFDGRLMIYQRFGGQIADYSDTLWYSYNDTPGTNRVTGWSTPQPITCLYGLVNGTTPDVPGHGACPVALPTGLASRGYPLARYPIKDGTGRLYTKTDGTVAPIHGAYAWISPEGADLFFEAAVSDDLARRAGTSLVGGSTKGMVRLVDGGPNVSLTGQAPPGTSAAVAATLASGPERLFVSTLGLTPGMWSPLELQRFAPVPLTDKRQTYPMFSSNSGQYFEVSCEETVTGNYDVYYDMTPAIVPPLTLGTGDTYDLTHVQDLSGNFRFGTKYGGAAFTYEPTSGEGTNGCTKSACQAMVPTPDTTLFSGTSLYFDGTGRIVGPTGVLGPTPKTTSGAQSFTVSLAVLPVDLGQIGANHTANLVSIPNVFDVKVDASGHVVADVWATPPGGTSTEFTIDTTTSRSTFTLTPNGKVRPTWTSLALTYDPVGGLMTLSANGVPVAGAATKVPVKSTLATTTTLALVIGPGNGSSAQAIGSTTQIGKPMLALDQVGVSRIVRTGPELMRQATMGFERLEPANSLPSGIQPKDIRSDLVLTDSTLGPTVGSGGVIEDMRNADLRNGEKLFFDKRLAENGDRSCSTCHVPDNAFTDKLQLEPSLVVGFQQSPHVLRNTPGLMYVALKENFFLDGRAASLSAQAVDVLNDGAEIGDSFMDAVGRVGMRTTDVENALQTFEASLILQPNAAGTIIDLDYPRDQTALGTDVLAGRALFFGKARCAQCHSGSGYTDGGYHVLPFLSATNADQVPDYGRLQATGGPDDAQKFATPSLRNIAYTAPYFHDGSVATIDDVIKKYRSVKPVAGDSASTNGGVQDVMLLPIDLTDVEAGQLAKFVLALSAAPESSASDAPIELLGGDASYPTSPAATTRKQTQTYSPGSGGTLLPIPNQTLPSLYEVGDVQAILQSDGNFVVYDGSGQPVWSTGTSRFQAGPNPTDVCDPKTAACTLRLALSAGQLILSATNTVTGHSATAWKTCIPGGPGLPEATQLQLSATEPYVRALDADGNIVWASSSRYAALSLDRSPSTPAVGQYASTSSTSVIGTAECNAPPPSYFALESDGYLRLCTSVPGTSGQCAHTWVAEDHGAGAGAPYTAAFQAADGNLVIRDKSMNAVFATGTSQPTNKQFLLLASGGQPHYVYIEDWTGKHISYPK